MIDQNTSKLLHRCVENVIKRLARLSDKRVSVEATANRALDEITVDRAVFGLFFSGVKLSTGHGGICFTPVKEMPQAVCCPSSARAMPYAGKLCGKSVGSYLADVFDANPLKRTLGIAALNALSTYILDLEGKLPPADSYMHYGDAFDQINVENYKKTVVVGALVPIMKKLIAADADWHVLEMDSRTLKGEELNHFLQADRAAEVVPDADLLVITGVTILNDSLPGLLSLAKPGAEIVVTGPTVSMLPEPLFDGGVTLTGGLIVTDADRTLDLISEGGSGYHLFGKCAERTVVFRDSSRICLPGSEEL